MPTIAQQQEYMVVKSNDIIQKSRYTMSLQQNKLLLYLISKIKPMDEPGESYEFSIGEFCKLCNIADAGTNYECVKAAVKALADKSLWVKKPNGKEVLMRWINEAETDERTQHIRITFHKSVQPYLYDLQQYYTQYALDNVLTMKSQYGIRLYELLKSYQYMKREIEFAVDELKTKLDANKYERYPDFRRYVLDAAILDINACSDLCVEYEARKEGRSVDRIAFHTRRVNVIEGIMRRNEKNERIYGKKRSRKTDCPKEQE